MKPRLICLLLATLSVGANSAEDPDKIKAEEIMSRIRTASAQQKKDLTGQLENGPVKTPFHLTMNGPIIRYEFKGTDKTYQLRLTEKQAILEQIDARGLAKPIGAGAEKQALFNTDISLEDLSFSFLYWPNAEFLRSEKAQGRPADVIRLRSPNSQSQYAYVDVWADQKTAGFLKVEAYGSDGKLAKDFTVVLLQEIDDSMFLKRLRIQVPKKTPDYIRIDHPERS